MNIQLPSKTRQIPPRILIVEERAPAAEALKTVLDDLGFAVAGTVKTADQAIQRIREGTPDLVLMDAGLAKRQRCENLDSILADQFQLPVLYLTAQTNSVTIHPAAPLPEGEPLEPATGWDLAMIIEKALVQHTSREEFVDLELPQRPVFDPTVDGIFIIDEQGVIMDVNPAGCALVSYSHSELVNAPFYQIELSGAKTCLNFMPGLSEEHSAKKFGCVLCDKYGSPVVVSMQVAQMYVAATQLFVMVVQRDQYNQSASSGQIDDLRSDARRHNLGKLTGFLPDRLRDGFGKKGTSRQRSHALFYDELTGLPNRALFIKRLHDTIRQVQHTEARHYAVLFLDLDRFKIVNDSLGRLAGDQLLIQLSRRIGNVLRSIDTLARSGGDEFVILLEEVSRLAEVISVVERIQEELKHPFLLNDRTIFTSVSMGVVMDRCNYHRPEDVLRDADIAMYRAKVEGKSRYVVFDEKLRLEAVTRLDLENDLKMALAKNQLEVHYQPILSLENYRINGFEALLRWNHPQRGAISPSNFISMAEETGQILQIGWWVLAEACRQLKAWQEEYPGDPPLTMSVNISGRQLAHPDMVAHIEQTLAKYHLAPHSLKLEITETQLIDHSPTTILAMNQLRDLGIQLLIDDFGMGFSALQYVHHFPIDTIKIDRLFINQIDAKNAYPEVAHLIINLAQELGMGTIAEGIETEEQLINLRKLKCAFGQGFLFAKALNRDRISYALRQISSKQALTEEDVRAILTQAANVPGLENQAQSNLEH